jgi:hypothetical protein
VLRIGLRGRRDPHHSRDAGGGSLTSSARSAFTTFSNSRSNFALFRFQPVKSAAIRERWSAVMDQFVLGSTYAYQLCRRFDIDPEEMVR